MWRKIKKKKNEEMVMEFYSIIGSHPNKDEIVDDLRKLSGFGICRAHAINLGRLIWALAYEKAHNPEKFWRAALTHCRGSYRKWVYQREGRLAGALTMGTELIDEVDEFKRLGYWTSPNFVIGNMVLQ